ncbi:MAG: hypothetical protein WAL91_07935 [Propionicimonas sp.]
MIEAGRRVLAGMAMAVVLALGGQTVPAWGVTPTPTPASAGPSASETAVPAATASAADDPTEVAPDNSGVVWAVGAAAGLAVLAGVVVFLRRK